MFKKSHSGEFLERLQLLPRCMEKDFRCGFFKRRVGPLVCNKSREVHLKGCYGISSLCLTSTSTTSAAVRKCAVYCNPRYMIKLSINQPAVIFHPKSICCLLGPLLQNNLNKTLEMLKKRKKEKLKLLYIQQAATLHHPG